MTNLIHIIGRAVSCIIMLLTLAVSCTHVEFDQNPIESIDSAELSKMSEISFTIKWPADLVAEDIPQVSTVLMNRIRNAAVHYVYYLDKDGTILFRQDSSEETPGTEAPVAVKDTVYTGTYSIAAVATQAFDDFVIPDLDRFPDSTDYRLRDVKVQVCDLPEDIKIQSYVDHNPIYPFIRPVKPFYFVRAMEESNFTILPNLENEILLEPTLLTRRINFRISLIVEEGVTIEDLRCVISGIPSSAELLTGIVSHRNTSQMPFDLTFVSAGDVTELTVESYGTTGPEESTEGSTEEDSAEGTPETTVIKVREHIYEGYINAFGLFPSTDPDLPTGPGILCYYIDASVEDEAGEVHRRSLYDGYRNIMEEITAASIMIETEDAAGYVFSDTEEAGPKEYSITVGPESSSRITRYRVLTGLNQGVSDWNDHGNDGSIGMNPEI